MILEFEQIRACIRGAVRVEQDSDGWIRMYRFTEEQANIYRNAGQTDFYGKTFASAGMRMAFRTNATNLSFTYRMRLASSRRYGWFDIYVNGVMTDHFGKEKDVDGVIGEAHISLPNGEKDVELYFPWSVSTDIRDLAIDGGALFTPVFRKYRMISYGDSITHGYDAIYPSQAYAVALARMLDADSVNKGIGGERFCPDVLLGTREPIEPDIITCAYGTNDWANATPQAKELFETNCRAFYKRLSALYPNARIYAITPIWRADGTAKKPFGSPAEQMHDRIAALCAGLPNVRVIRGWELVPHIPAFYGDLRLHPNDLGFLSYAQGLYREIVTQ